MPKVEIEYRKPKLGSSFFKADIFGDSYADIDLRISTAQDHFAGLVKSKPVTITWMTASHIRSTVDLPDPSCIYKFQLRKETPKDVRTEWHVWYETEKQWCYFELDLDAFGMYPDLMTMLAMVWRVDTLYCYLEQ